MKFPKYCETPQSVVNAVSVLSQSPEIILAIEGKDLGLSPSGALSVISVGSSRDARRIFVFDILQLCPGNSTTTIQPLLDLLSSDRCLKLMWDGRKARVELYEAFRCKLRNVLDLQVAELVSRWKVSREGEEVRRHRLQWGYFGFAPVRKNPEAYHGIHRVLKLHECAEKLKMAQRGMDANVMKMYEKSGSDMWMVRPLATMLRNHASRNIELIAKLYPRFHDNGLLVSTTLRSQIIEFSENYLEARATVGREVKQNNPFRQNVLILEPVLYSWDATRERMMRCTRCLHILPVERCFHTKPDKDGEPLRRTVCRRCVVVAWKHGLPPHQTLRDEWELDSRLDILG